MSNVIVTDYAELVAVATVLIFFLVLLLWVLWLIEATTGKCNSLQLYNDFFIREYYCLFPHLLSFLIALILLIMFSYVTIVFVGLRYIGYKEGKLYHNKLFIHLCLFVVADTVIQTIPLLNKFVGK